MLIYRIKNIKQITIRAIFVEGFDPHFLFSMYPFWVFDSKGPLSLIGHLHHFALRHIEGKHLTFCVSNRFWTSQKGYKLLRKLLTTTFHIVFARDKTQVKTLQREKNRVRLYLFCWRGFAAYRLIWQLRARYPEFPIQILYGPREWAVACERDAQPNEYSHTWRGTCRERAGTQIDRD